MTRDRKHIVEWSFWKKPGGFLASTVISLLAVGKLILDYKETQEFHQGPLGACIAFSTVALLMLFFRTRIRIQRDPFVFSVRKGPFKREILRHTDLENFYLSYGAKLNDLTFGTYVNGEPITLFRAPFIFSFHAAKKNLEIQKLLGLSPSQDGDEERALMALKSRTPWLTIFLVASNIMVFVYALFFSENGLVEGALDQESIANHQHWQLLTYLFLHAGILHIFFNMTALFDLGQKVEVAIGRKRFFVLYFLSGIVAGFNALFFLNGAKLVGASGAIFGLLGAQVFLGKNPKTARILGQISRVDIISCLLISLLPGISFSAHVGGFIVGLGFGYIYSKRINTQSISDRVI